jgi:hypothetical protein
MDIGLLAKFFGKDKSWRGACTVILDAEASVQTVGGDTLLTGGVKNYAPRLVSGRILADSVCLLPDYAALLVFQQVRLRQQTGEEVVKQTLLAIDAAHVVALEFHDLDALDRLGVAEPVVHSDGSYPPGTLVG